MPLLAWGRDFNAQYEAKGSPASMSCFELGPPHAGMCVYLDERCPMQYVNDPRGIENAKANITVIQQDNPQEFGPALVHAGESDCPYCRRRAAIF